MADAVIYLKRTSKYIKKIIFFFHIRGFKYFLGKPQFIPLNQINRTFTGELVWFLWYSDYISKYYLYEYHT